MKEEDQSPHGREEEQTVSSLLVHLQHMRQAVYVNYQLKAELKKQLLQRMQERFPPWHKENGRRGAATSP